MPVQRVSEKKKQYHLYFMGNCEALVGSVQGHLLALKDSFDGLFDKENEGQKDFAKSCENA